MDITLTEIDMNKSCTDYTDIEINNIRKEYADLRRKVWDWDDKSAADKLEIKSQSPEDYDYIVNEINIYREHLKKISSVIKSYEEYSNNKKLEEQNKIQQLCDMEKHTENDKLNNLFEKAKAYVNSIGHVLSSNDIINMNRNQRQKNDFIYSALILFNESLVKQNIHNIYSPITNKDYTITGDDIVRGIIYDNIKFSWHIPNRADLLSLTFDREVDCYTGIIKTEKLNIIDLSNERLALPPKPDYEDVNGLLDTEIPIIDNNDKSENNKTDEIENKINEVNNNTNGKKVYLLIASSSIAMNIPPIALGIYTTLEKANQKWKTLPINNMVTKIIQEFIIDDEIFNHQTINGDPEDDTPEEIIDKDCELRFCNELTKNQN